MSSWNDDHQVPYRRHVQLLRRFPQGFSSGLLYQALSRGRVSDHVRLLSRSGKTLSARRGPGTGRYGFFDLSRRGIFAAVERFDAEGAPWGYTSLGRELFLAKDPRLADHRH